MLIQSQMGRRLVIRRGTREALARFQVAVGGGRLGRAKDASSSAMAAAAHIAI